MKPRISRGGTLKCEKLKYAKFLALRHFRYTNNSADLAIYLHNQKSFKMTCKQKKLEFQSINKRKLVDSRKDPKLFWSILKQSGSKPHTFCYDDTDKWIDYFQNLLHKDNQPSIETFPSENISDNNQNQILNKPISIEEITSSIKSLKNRKAQGTNGIGSEFYKNTCELITPYLCTLFNEIFNTAIFPDMWRDSIIVPVYKSGSKDDSSNYRGISLINESYKIFSNIHKRLCIWAKTYNKLDEAQAGFRPGYSTVHNMFILQCLIQKYISKPGRGGRFYVLFIDFQKAFDSINHLNLFTSLKQKGLNGKILQILISMYSEMNSYVCINEKLSDQFTFNVGTRQGDITSNIIFNLYINDLCTLLRDKGHSSIYVTDDIPNILCILFADDVANCAETAINLQQQLNSIHKYCSLTGMSINQNKTEVMVFRNGGPLRYYEKWKFGKYPIRVTPFYNYMGLLFTPKLSWSKAKNKLASQAKKTIFAIKSFKHRFGSFDYHDYFKLLDTMVKPILLYGSEIFGTEISEQLEKVQISYCKEFLGINKSVNDCMVLGECGKLPLYVEYHYKAVKYWTKLIHMPIHRYPGSCYKMIKSLDDIGRETWALSVKQLLYLYGFSIIWVTQEIGDTDLFLSVFSQRLKDCATQNWRDMINNSNRCSFYKNFKSLLAPENI